MSRYLARLKMKRFYTWGGRPTGINRKIRASYYDSLCVRTDGQPEGLLIQAGQHILIESDDDDAPYVAKLLKLFGDETGKTKRAEVQWFVRYCEVPHNRRKLLDRAPHPQEVFLYKDQSCDTQIDAETIIGTVQMVHLAPSDPFPENGGKGTLFVKLVWDTKAFRPVEADHIQLGTEPAPPVGPQPARGTPGRRSLPTPDKTVMKRALAVSVSQLPVSTGKLGVGEAESNHSASKLSAAKALSRKRQSSCLSTPGVRKKLELSSPGTKLSRDDVLDELLAEEVRSQRELSRQLPSSPPQSSARVFCLSPEKPVNKAAKVMVIAPSTRCAPRSLTWGSPVCGEDSTRARTPSRGKESSSTSREPVLGSLAEELSEFSDRTDMTPRSQRKSARLVSSRIREQLNLLNTSQEAISDDDNSVSSKKDLESSSEEEDGVEDESENDSIASRRRKTVGSQTLRSTRKASAPTRTPRKTHTKKAPPSTPHTPRHATPSIPTRSLPVRKPGNVLEEARARARTPSRGKESSSTSREPVLGSLAEELSEFSDRTDMTPRSQRKSARLVSSRIREQLNLLNTSQEAISDDDKEDDHFVPSKKDLESSSEEEDGVEDESENDSIASRRRKTVGSQTLRSTRKASAPTRTPRKTHTKKAPPGTPHTPRHATPSIPTRSLPVRKPGNVLEEARARLHVSSVPESLPCREQEFQDIYNFVESKIVDGIGGCMYISGVPGTGKTATVHEVIRCLQHASEQGDLPPFIFIEINGMKMTDPHQAYVQILQKLTDQKATADHAATLLEKRFSSPAPKKVTTVILVDELDLLWTRRQNVMYNLFDWPTRRQARLVVLAIANTMDLPERIMINRVASRLGLTRMSFQPYSFKQLQQIITSRLNHVRAFEEDALQLVSRKVAALSGDARRCLDICRRATEICEHASTQQPSSELVGMSHVMEALDEMFSSPYITAIRCASIQEQLFLRAVLAEFRRLGLEEATFQQVFVQHQALCRVEGLQPLSVSEGLAVCQRLGACRLLLLEASRLDLLLRVRLNVSQDDVLYALKDD